MTAEHFENDFNLAVLSKNDFNLAELHIGLKDDVLPIVELCTLWLIVAKLCSGY